MKKKASTIEAENVETTITSGSMIIVILAIWAVFGAISILVAKYTAKPGKTIASKGDVKMEAKLLLDKINALYDLPTGEAPTIATVSDKSKLQKQSFFAKAENGDKVLIYTDAKKAILYRPSLNKIMEIAPLALTFPSSQPTQGKTVAISIYNGTKTAGAATTTEKKLTGSISNIEISEKSDAKLDYKKTIVIDLSGKNNDLVKKIATLLNGSPSSMPTGEKAPKGEILIIVGE